MHLDVVDLRNFYYRTRLGRAAQAAIGQQVAEFWPEAKGLSVAGFGFAVPCLRRFLDDARRVLCLMPGQQGVMPWPAGGPNVSILCEETAWPVETGHIDRLIVMHGLETSEHPAALLEECWRALGPGGKVLFIVPNRAGMWARRDGTPFGFGRPYSLGQMEAELKRQNFVPERHRAALFHPPSNRRFWLRLGPVMEKAGRRLPTAIAGGILIVEASKRVHAPTRPGLPEAVRKPLRVLEGIKNPDAKPARVVP